MLPGQYEPVIDGRQGWVSQVDGLGGLPYPVYIVGIDIDDDIKFNLRVSAWAADQLLLEVVCGPNRDQIAKRTQVDASPLANMKKQRRFNNCCEPACHCQPANCQSRSTAGHASSRRLVAPESSRRRHESGARRTTDSRNDRHPSLHESMPPKWPFLGARPASNPEGSRRSAPKPDATSPDSSAIATPPISPTAAAAASGQPPPRPPRPKTSLPNLRPQIILSPIALAPPYNQHPALRNQTRSAKPPRIFTDDVLASLRDHGKSGTPIWLSSPVTKFSPSSSSITVHSAQIFDRAGGAVAPAAACDARTTLSSRASTHQSHYHFASQSIDPEKCWTVQSPATSGSSSSYTSTSYSKQKHAAATTAFVAQHLIDPPVALTPRQLWLLRHRRMIWMIATLVFVLIAATAIAGGVIWKLTTVGLTE